MADPPAGEEEAEADTGEKVTLSGGASQITATTSATIAHRMASALMDIFLALVLLDIRSGWKRLISGWTGRRQTIGKSSLLRRRFLLEPDAIGQENNEKTRQYGKDFFP